MSRTPAWRKALPAPADGKGNLRIYAKHDVGGMICEAVFDYRDLPSSVVTQILKFVQQVKPAVHILRCGLALCGLEGMPKDWPEGHTWVQSGTFNDGEATCGKCIEAAKLVDKRT